MRFSTVPIEKLRSLFYVVDGAVFRKVLCGGQPPGARFGSTHNGYRRGQVAGVHLLEHRVAWAIAHGEWPPEVVDHVHGDRGRTGDTRLASHRTNRENVRAPRSDNRLQVMGVRQTGPNSYSARAMTRGVSVILGTFRTAELAHAAYLTWKRANHEGCTI
jgi:hypothetical protein